MQSIKCSKAATSTTPTKSPKKPAKLSSIVPGANTMRSPTQSPATPPPDMPDSPNIAPRSPRLMTTMPRPDLSGSPSSSRSSASPTTPTSPCPWGRPTVGSPISLSRSTTPMVEPAIKDGSKRDRTEKNWPRLGSSSMDYEVAYPVLCKPTPRESVPKIILTSPDGSIEKINPSDWRHLKAPTWDDYNPDRPDVTMLYRDIHEDKWSDWELLTAPAEPLTPSHIVVEVPADFDFVSSADICYESHDYWVLLNSGLVAITFTITKCETSTSPEGQKN